MQMAALDASASAPRPRQHGGPPRLGVVAAVAAVLAGLPTAAGVEARPLLRRGLREPALLEGAAQGWGRQAAADPPAPAAGAPAPAAMVFNLMNRATTPADFVAMGIPPPNPLADALMPPWPMLGPPLPSLPWADVPLMSKKKPKGVVNKVMKAEDILANAQANAMAVATGASPSPAGSPAPAPSMSPAASPAGRGVVLASPLILGPFPGGQGALFEPKALANLKAAEAADETEQKFMEDSYKIVSASQAENIELATRLKDLSAEVNRQSVDYWYALNNRTMVPNPPLGPHGGLYPKSWR